MTHFDDDGRPVRTVPFDYGAAIPGDLPDAPSDQNGAALARFILEAALDAPGRSSARRALLGAAAVLLTGRSQAEIATRFGLSKPTLNRATRHLRTILHGMDSIAAISQRIKEKRSAPPE